MKKILTISATALAAAIALAGCSAGSSGGSMPGMNHGSSGTSSSSAPAAAADHNAADTMFTQGMIPHHTQAVEMSDMMLKKQGIDPKVTALATKIKADQGPEITTMTGWLKTWNEPSQMSGGHSMTGMMGEEDMGKLQTAQGTDAAKLFLTQMIAHHQGAVMMAKTEESGGKNTDAVALSKNIVVSQQAEIQEMKDLLGTL
ncbi:DUF305 domain-containing protein [Pseudarthrobacter sp. NIBRBAC000502770]|uniref:DUF305 domain-containing protein n=1 Tax=Pseudarthrobacter sp. NIBRBAC000502770 TaxID=2590785 RepID=UPI00114093A9|nr:DUF305 domain-containing protein [Pseudarthrobacter sp. NIBRBAC000502770]QDG87091.1 DUF305 domain-containing protein [Pseudarthrobacter sp. NIBRBAC000502770]